MNLTKFTLLTCICKLRRYFLKHKSANHMSQSNGTLEPHLVKLLSLFASLTLVHMYVPRVPKAVQLVHHMLTIGSQRTRRVFCNSLRCSVVVCHIAHSNYEPLHVPPGTV